MKYLLIMNPGSNSNQSKKLWKLWFSLLEENKVNFEKAITKSMEHATQIAKEARGFDTIVAVGGDGTINRVISGILASENCNCGFGVLYSGTSPDFCKFHKIPLNPDQAISALLSHKTKYIDIAKITFQNFIGHNEHAYFSCSCNIGLGAKIAYAANRSRRYLGDFCGTAFASIKTICTSKKINLLINSNNQTQQLTNINNFSILINPIIASGIKLNIIKQPDDGRLILFTIQNKSFIALLKDMPMFYTGSIASSKNTFLSEILSGTEIEIVSEKKQAIEFDGDARGYLPATISLLPKKLKLVGTPYA